MLGSVMDWPWTFKNRNRISIFKYYKQFLNLQLWLIGSQRLRTHSLQIGPPLCHLLFHSPILPPCFRWPWRLQCLRTHGLKLALLLVILVTRYFTYSLCPSRRRLPWRPTASKLTILLVILIAHYGVINQPLFSFHFIFISFSCFALPTFHLSIFPTCCRRLRRPNWPTTSKLTFLLVGIFLLVSILRSSC